jgi:hypothetical protein
MMPESEDWAVLGIAPGAPLDEVHRAYRRRIELYRANALATYSLLSDQERAELVARIERAYHRIVGDHAESAVPDREPDHSGVTTGVPASLPPDPMARPGAYLRHRREVLGLSLSQVTARTKIRAAVLQALEAEDFTALPAEVYVRGFVVQIGKVLALPDAPSLSERYIACMRSARGREA